MLPDFWNHQREVNAKKAIFHQWQELETSGCIHNFRIAAGEAESLREGWFFADSDAYKWLEAASRILAVNQDVRLSELVDNFINLLRRTQTPDGYLFTYNQIHFPDARWQNLQIEHELYCHGHLIEAGVSHFEATGRTDLLEVVRKAADRIVVDFHGKGPEYTPGHEEIEIALLRLYQVAKDRPQYLEMARQFIEQRGRDNDFALHLLKQNIRVGQRSEFVKQQRQAYLVTHSEIHSYKVPPGNQAKIPWNTTLRWYAGALSGKYFQQHAPIRKQIVPVGHSVRFAYLETAVTKLAGLTGDTTLVPALEQAWEHMVNRRMYVTGGIGSLPGLEGFGNDYELDPEYAYAETCAALGSLFWNWEMAKLRNQAKYSDLFEWQLYNAVAVGMGLDGTSYLYNNPLTCKGGVKRQSWYAIPCCPSNISRTWANLSQYSYTHSEGRIFLNQYISSGAAKITLLDTDGKEVNLILRMDSQLPWEGHAQITIDNISSFHNQSGGVKLSLRHPSWAKNMEVIFNGNNRQTFQLAENALPITASGIYPQMAVFQELNHLIQKGDVIDVYFDTDIQLRRAHPRVKNHKGKTTVTRGPLVYCLESTANPDVDIFSIMLDPKSLSAQTDQDLLGGVMKITGKSVDGKELVFIPYFLWGNCGSSQMTVWVNTLQDHR
jgi:uncharacterized protein